MRACQKNSQWPKLEQIEQLHNYKKTMILLDYKSGNKINIHSDINK